VKIYYYINLEDNLMDKKCYRIIKILLIVVLGVGTLWHLQKFLQCFNYITFEFTPFTALLHPHSPIPGIVSRCIIFAVTYMCTQCLHCIHLPLPTGTLS
jgi:hypothetical protein